MDRIESYGGVTAVEPVYRSVDRGRRPTYDGQNEDYSGKNNYELRSNDYNSGSRLDVYA